jgi:hypothetical protein
MMRQVGSVGFSGFSGGFVDRITCYRERAQEFREMAESEPNDRMREHFFDLAARYDLIADALGAKGSRFL